jgi:heme o synthase
VIDYWILIRPKIVAMVLGAMLASAWAAAEILPQWTAIFHAMFGAACIISGAIALNQRLECRGDAKMPRTADRPLPAGRLSAAQVTQFGTIASLLGILYLIWFGNATLVIFAVVGWIIYVLVYTPLKRRSIWQTPVGAAAGAMPVILGAAAVGEPLSPIGWTIFGVVFFWQLPHAMAIAWLYRGQFADAGVRVATVVDPSGRIAGYLAVAGATLLLPVSLTPALYWPLGWTYAITAGLLGMGYLALSLSFFRRTGDITARRLLWASLVYLPLVLVMLVASRLYC